MFGASKRFINTQHNTLFSLLSFEVMFFYDFICFLSLFYLVKGYLGMNNEITKRRKRTIEMTQGSLWKNMFFFSVPLIFSQILEVMFNLSDVAVVGHFADYKALGSVGSTTTLVTLFTGLLIGLGSGVNVRLPINSVPVMRKLQKKPFTLHSLSVQRQVFLSV